MVCYHACFILTTQSGKVLMLLSGKMYIYNVLHCACIVLLLLYCFVPFYCTALYLYTKLLCLFKLYHPVSVNSTFLFLYMLHCAVHCTVQCTVSSIYRLYTGLRAACTHLLYFDVSVQYCICAELLYSLALYLSLYII